MNLTARINSLSRITNKAGPGKTQRTVIQKIFDELPVP
jgi:hypothetical protein